MLALHVPWPSVRHARRPLEILTRTIRHSKSSITASFQLSRDSPAAEALKRHPYPSSTPDRSIFEDHSEEYAALSRHPVTSKSVPRNSIQTLVHLVEQRDYNSAERVLADLLQLGIEIPLDKRYEKVAISILNLPEGQARETAFTTWFSLIPMAHDSAPRSFHAITQKLLFSSRYPDSSLILRFGLICAYKGYARKIFRQIIPFVVRFTDPPVSASWLKEFEKFAVNYTRSFHTSEVRKMLKSFRDLVIRAHCQAGRTDEAFRVFQATKQEKIPTSRFTTSLLLRSLQKINDMTKIEQLTNRYKLPVETPVERIPSSGHSQHNAILSSNSLSSTASLAMQLRYLKKAITSPCPPSVGNIVDFIHQYHSTGRRRALLMLKKRAFQNSPRSTSLWVMAEMIYYLDKQRYDLVLLTFTNNFHLIGVPWDHVLKQLESSKKKILSMKDRSLSTVMLGRYPMSEKMYPTPSHITLLWKALVSLSKDQESLQSLYQQLLHLTRLLFPKTPAVDSSSPTNHPVSVSAHPPPSQTIDNIHFNPFVFEFRQRFGPYRAAQILQDMQELGIRPNYYQFAILAEGFAYVGDVPRTTAFLDAAEECYRSRSANDVDLYPNPVTMYTNILRSLIAARRLDAAMDVEARLFRNTMYRQGDMAYTDQMRSLLRDHLRKTVVPSVS